MPVYRKGLGGGYWYYVVGIVVLLAFVIAYYSTNGFGTR